MNISKETYIVIGSGPSGVSVAYALLKRGKKVALLDVGYELEKKIQLQLKNMKSKLPEEWVLEDIENFKVGLNPTKSGVPLKRSFGSDFPYRVEPEFLQFNLDEVDVRGSFAKGGFSNVWGAAVLPYHDQDLKNWPIPLKELEPHYRAVMDFLPVTGNKKDPTTELFPFYTENVADFSHSKQSENIYSHLNINRNKLINSGIFHGKARVAVHSDPILNTGQACQKCGLCLYGCPYGLIFSTSSQIEYFKKNYDHFSYYSGIYVDEVRDVEIGLEKYVEVQVKDIQKNEIKTLLGKKLFLGAGVFHTARILLKSNKRIKKELDVKYSEYFMFPMITFQAVKNIEKEKLNTLAQLFLEISDPQLSPHLIHLQLYSFSDLFLKTFEKALGPLFFIFKPFVLWLLTRFIIVQGFLHSDESSSMKMNYEPKGNILKISAMDKKKSYPLIRKVISKLTKNSLLIGAFPLGFLKSVGPTGKGFHFGGTFPMGYLSDLLGRPQGFENIHVVDSSVFPDIPATTITYTVMANAHRIGSIVD